MTIPDGWDIYCKMSTNRQRNPNIPYYKYSDFAKALGCLRVLLVARVEIQKLKDNKFNIIFPQNKTNQSLVDAYRELFVPKNISFDSRSIQSSLKPKYKEVWGEAYNIIYL